MRLLAVSALVALALGFAAPAQAPSQRHRTEAERAFRRAVGHELARLQTLNGRLRQSLRHRPSVREALSLASVVYGVPRWQLAAVAYCESTQRADAYNGGSGASGLMQFLPQTFAATPFGRAGMSIFSPYASALAAAWKVAREGSWRAWTCRP